MLRSTQFGCCELYRNRSAKGFGAELALCRVVHCPRSLKPPHLSCKTGHVAIRTARLEQSSPSRGYSEQLKPRPRWFGRASRSEQRPSSQPSQLRLDKPSPNVARASTDSTQRSSALAEAAYRRSRPSFLRLLRSIDRNAQTTSIRRYHFRPTANSLSRLVVSGARLPLERALVLDTHLARGELLGPLS